LGILGLKAVASHPHEDVGHGPLPREEVQGVAEVALSPIRGGDGH